MGHELRTLLNIEMYQLIMLAFVIVGTLAAVALHSLWRER